MDRCVFLDQLNGFIGFLAVLKAGDGPLWDPLFSNVIYNSIIYFVQ